MYLSELHLEESQTAQILNESWSRLTESQQFYLHKWETNVWPLVEQYSRLLEADLTADQIQNIFKNAEQTATASGNNRTALGKAGDVGKKMQAEISKLMQAAKAGPIDNIDQNFEQLKSKLAKSLQGTNYGPGVLKTIEAWKGFAEGNPIKSAFVIGAMTSILAFASGGIVSGAAIGFFLKLSNNIIKGDKLSTAVGKGIKGALIGAAAGALSDFFNDDQIEAIKTAKEEDLDEIVKVFSNPELDQQLDNLDIQRSVIDNMIDKSGLEDAARWNMTTTINGTMFHYEPVMTADEYAEYNNIDGIKERLIWLQKFMSQPDYQAREETFDNLVKLKADLSAEEQSLLWADKELKADLEAVYNNVADDWDATLKATQTMHDKIDAAVAGGVTAAATKDADKKKQESIEESLWDALELHEAGFGDIAAKAKQGAAALAGKVDKAATAAGQKVKQGVKAAGHQLGNKVTSAKLMRMWKKSGSPTDVGSIANILRTAGLDDEQIGLVSKQSNVELKTREPAQQGQQATKPAAQQGQQAPVNPKQQQRAAQAAARTRSQPAQQQVDPAMQKLIDFINKNNLGPAIKQYLATA